MHRLFIAIPLPLQAKKNTEYLIMQLLQQADLIKFEPFEKLHITLTFIGKVSQKKQQKLVELLPDFGNEKPITVELFPQLIKSASVIAIKIKDNAAIASLAIKIHTTLINNGFSLENRPYTPHLTLARIRKNASMPQRKLLKKQIKDIMPQKLFSFLTEKIVLYESTLTRNGSIYTIVAHEDFSD